MPMVATANYGPNSHLKQKRQSLEVLDMQRDAYSRAMDASLPDKERREWMKVYDTLAERRRILAGRPLPGSLVHEKRRPAQRRQSLADSMLASLAEQPAPPEQPA